VTKKEIVKQIAEKIEETQLKTKEIVQLTFDAIVETLINDRRIELRNFGVFEVKLRKARKARNPRTDDPVDVPPKYVVTFKPGKEMEERVRKLIPSAEELEALERKSQKAAQNRQPAQPEPAPSVSSTAVSVPAEGNGTTPEPTDGQTARPKKPRARKATQV
jgi:integration host factor subunit beta